MDLLPQAEVVIGDCGNFSVFLGASPSAFLVLGVFHGRLNKRHMIYKYCIYIV